MHSAIRVARLVTVVAIACFPQNGEGSKGQADPCKQASSQMQMNLCSAEDYKKADARLNIVYAKLLSLLGPHGVPTDGSELKYKKTSVAKLRAAESEWIKYRDLHCDAAAQLYQGGSMKPLMWANCMRDTTEDRIHELKAAYEDGDWKLE